MLDYRRIWKAFVLTMRDCCFLGFILVLVIGYIVLLIKMFGSMAIPAWLLSSAIFLAFFSINWHQSND